MNQNESAEYVCSECNSNNIEEQCWARINTSEVTSIIEGEYWCPDCESHEVSIKEVSKINNSKTSQSTKSEYCSEVADAYLRSYFVGEIDLAENYTRQAQEHFNALWDELMAQIEDRTIFNLCTVISPEDNIYGISWQNADQEPKIYAFSSPAFEI